MYESKGLNMGRGSFVLGWAGMDVIKAREEETQCVGSITIQFHSNQFSLFI